MLQTIQHEQDIASERLRRIYGYWRTKSGSNRAPRRDAILPGELRKDLPWVWLADVSDDGSDFGFRLAGEELRRFLGVQFSPKRFSECPKTPFFTNVAKVFAHCVATRLPLLVGPVRTNYEEQSFQTIAVLVMPLSQDGENVSMLFGGFETAKLADVNTLSPALPTAV